MDENKQQIVKKIGVKNIVVIGLCGIALIALSVYPSGNNKGEKMDNDSQNNEQQCYISDFDYKNEYVKEIEKKLTDTLNKIPNAAPVTVMVTLKSGEEKKVLKDTTVSKDNTSEDVVTFKNKNEDYPYIIQMIEPQIEGILIITGSNANGEIINDIYDATEALFELEAHKIKVIRG